jgi:hypothetical protein
MGGKQTFCLDNAVGPIEHSVTPPLNLYLTEKRTNTDLLHLKFNSLSFALGFESIGPLIIAL